MTHACPSWGICGMHPPSEIAADAKHGSSHYWQFSKVHTGPGLVQAFQVPGIYDNTTKFCR
jgi:hypothetical protein